MLKENVELWEEELRNSGRTEGRIEGKIEGESETLRKVAREILARFYGTLPQDVLTQISQAESEALYRVIRSIDPAKPLSYCTDFLADGMPSASDRQSDTL